MQRYIALLILVIPAILAGYGIKLMRDTVFQHLITPFPNLWIQFFCGLLFLLGGLGFVGGFIFHRDRKNGKVAPKYRK
ncbi:DUF2627 domain-containing protein [Bacillus alkalicellulosilyticus]|uniref:DUF2627 domain-containing protein n=1 Tax=Alkalihalobacterium alkalicellulosilyticum TaxID=1912214 RepID=UPI000997FEDC|nr:DUF2627 domain-containing protein [Bacillus alkalicellulosilyticus]